MNNVREALTIFKKAIFLIAFLLFCQQIIAKSEYEGMVFVNGGSFFPPLTNQKIKSNIKSFYLDKFPVTRKEYKKFLDENPPWRKDQIKSIFADQNYLSDWENCSFMNPSCEDNLPVTNISWFSARAFCAWQQKRLPTILEWEFAATNGGTLNQNDYDKILEWYSKPNVKMKVGTVWKSQSGAYDLLGSVWEWVEDFNTTSVTEDSRGDSSLDRTLFCGGTSLALKDFKNYASYMRFAYRSGLKGKYTIANLGFRCAKDISQQR